MILLQVNDLHKYFGADLILSNIKLEVQTRDKIALVGRNGSGKSTLLKIIAGQLSHDGGEIMKPRNVSIGYLAQNTGLQSTRTIWNEMLSVFESLLVMEQDLRKLELEMAEISSADHKKEYEHILKNYDELQMKFKDEGGYQYEADIRSILHGLQFQNIPYDTPISSLSGGQKTRLALGKLLLTKPDILILDEPTNHLDIETLSWLEQYLSNYDGAILIVSHDRYFLDKIVHTVYEIAHQTMEKFTGNYSDYLDKKAEHYERDLKLYEKQQGEIAALEDFVQRNIARASTTKRAQSRRRQLERMERVDRPLGDEKSASFHFNIARQSGNEVLHVNELAVGYERVVSKNIDFQMTRGESIALIGPNGIGKSTLLKTITGELPPLAGDFRLGTNVSIGYYDQELAALHSNKRALHELWDEYPLADEKTIRTVLGNFLLSGDDVLKPVAALSGGEKARLALAKLFMLQANFLVLDEPTNHLDLDSKEVLENALIDYPGTILFVSHDRYFINRIASKVIDLSPDGVTEYLGDYTYFIEKKQEQEERAALEEVSEAFLVTEQTDAKLAYEQDKEMKRIERQRTRRIEEIEKLIDSLEGKLTENEQLLCEPEVYQDHERVLTLNKKNKDVEKQLSTLLDEWAHLSE